MYARYLPHIFSLDLFPEYEAIILSIFHAPAPLQNGVVLVSLEKETGRKHKSCGEESASYKYFFHNFFQQFTHLPVRLLVQ